MKRILHYSLIILVLQSCDNDKTAKQNSNVKSVTSENSEMNIAIREAKKTFPQFVTAYISHRWDSTGFAIKVRFPTKSGGGEHFWTSKLSYHDGAFWGVVNEAPVDSTVKIKIGEVFKIDTTTITDWEYINDKYLSLHLLW